MLMKEIKENTNKWKTFYANGLEDNIVVNITQSDLQIQYNLYQNPNDFFFAEIEKNPS